jgi:hypothetical protein
MIRRTPHISHARKGSHRGGNREEKIKACPVQEFKRVVVALDQLRAFDLDNRVANVPVAALRIIFERRAD